MGIYNSIDNYNTFAKYRSCYSDNGLWIIPHRFDSKTLHYEKWINWESASGSDYKKRVEELGWANAVGIKFVFGRNVKGNIRVLTVIGFDENDKVKRNSLIGRALRKLGLSKNYPWVIDSYSSSAILVKTPVREEFKEVYLGGYETRYERLEMPQEKHKMQYFYNNAIIRWFGICELPSPNSYCHFHNDGELPQTEIEEVYESTLIDCAKDLRSFYDKYIKNVFEGVLEVFGGITGLIILICIAALLLRDCSHTLNDYDIDHVHYERY